uniref:EGF-like domain-containing protein n=1 Tax=Alexandrium catenella TaxID=2925 RepID=A0A7S1S3X6_ALECA
MAQERRGNRDLHIVVNSTVHFRGRYVMLDLFEAITRQYPPDEWGNEFARDTIFSVWEVKVWEHTGGGGVFGIQSADGMEYSTVAYGLRQPGEWILSSERDLVTEDIRGFSSGSYDEDLGGLAHVVVTFQTISRPSQDTREVEIAFFRNGFRYGDPYRRIEPFNRLRQSNTTRAIFGVRSSAHDVQPGNQDPRQGVIHGSTHSPFFEGHIHNVTIIKNALTPEEVLGLYEVNQKGGEEKGCHCYDACPTGFNRFFPGYPVPCSGQGVCRRFFRAVSMAPGRCDCNPGYSGEACQFHCSELSQYGCCEMDDDCPEGSFCIQSTKACSI